MHAHFSSTRLDAAQSVTILCCVAVYGCMEGAHVQLLTVSCTSLLAIAFLILYSMKMDAGANGWSHLDDRRGAGCDCSIHSAACARLFRRMARYEAGHSVRLHVVVLSCAMRDAPVLLRDACAARANKACDRVLRGGRVPRNACTRLSW